MKPELRILILDDVPTDAELMAFELSESGINFEPSYASDRNSFLKALDDFLPDIILSDYSLPSFNGLSALKIVRERYPDMPFIFVSGALGEELAIELLKKGATDYVLKNRLSRLVPAVIRAMQEVEERIERKRAEDALKESESRYRSIFENTGTATIIVDEGKRIILANRQFEQLAGMQSHEIGKRSWYEFVHPDDVIKTEEFDRRCGLSARKAASDCELRIVNSNGNIYHTLANIAWIPPTKKQVLSLLDITKLKEAEQKIVKTNEMLRSITSELVMTEERERRRIAVDLHDNIAQTLAITKLKLDSLLDGSHDDKSVESLEEIIDLIKQAIGQTRSLMTDLSPSVLYELGLTDAMEWLAEQIQERHGLRIILKKDPKICIVDKDLQALLFRSARELLLNVVKHAQAKEAYIILQKLTGQISVTVKDNGTGFNISKIDHSSGETGGFGLLSIRERLNHIGGIFEIETEKGQGTCIRLIVPDKKSRKKRKSKT